MWKSILKFLTSGMNAVMVAVVIILILVFFSVKGAINRRDNLIAELYSQSDSLVQLDSIRYRINVELKAKLEVEKQYSSDLVGSLQEWYELTGVYHPWELEGEAVESTFVDTSGVEQSFVSFEKDTGVIHIWGWTSTPPPRYMLGIIIDPLSLKIAVEKLKSGLKVAHIWSSDPQFKLEKVELKQLWKDERHYDWFGWLLGVRGITDDITDLQKYDWEVSGGMRLWQWQGLVSYGLREVDDELKGYTSFGIWREF